MEFANQTFVFTLWWVNSARDLPAYIQYIPTYLPRYVAAVESHAACKGHHSQHIQFGRNAHRDNMLWAGGPGAKSVQTRSPLSVLCLPTLCWLMPCGRLMCAMPPHMVESITKTIEFTYSYIPKLVWGARLILLWTSHNSELWNGEYLIARLLLFGHKLNWYLKSVLVCHYWHPTQGHSFMQFIHTSST